MSEGGRNAGSFVESSGIDLLRSVPDPSPPLASLSRTIGLEEIMEGRVRPRPVLPELEVLKKEFRLNRDSTGERGASCEQLSGSEREETEELEALRECGRLDLGILKRFASPAGYSSCDLGMSSMLLRQGGFLLLAGDPNVKVGVLLGGGASFGVFDRPRCGRCGAGGDFVFRGGGGGLRTVAGLLSDPEGLIPMSLSFSLSVPLSYAGPDSNNSSNLFFSSSPALLAADATAIPATPSVPLCDVSTVTGCAFVTETFV